MFTIHINSAQSERTDDQPDLRSSDHSQNKGDFGAEFANAFRKFEGRRR